MNPSDFIAGIALLVSIGTAAAGWLHRRSQRKISEVVVRTEVIRGEHDGILVVENLGPAIARNVVVELTEPLSSGSLPTLHEAEHLFPLPELPPGSTLRVFVSTVAATATHHVGRLEYTDDRGRHAKTIVVSLA